jgi:hypothetical protein
MFTPNTDVIQNVLCVYILCTLDNAEINGITDTRDTRDGLQLFYHFKDTCTTCEAVLFESEFESFINVYFKL